MPECFALTLNSLSQIWATLYAHIEPILPSPPSKGGNRTKPDQSLPFKREFRGIKPRFVAFAEICVYISQIWEQGLGDEGVIALPQVNLQEG